MGSMLKGFGLFTRKRRGHRPSLFDRHPGQAIVLIAFLMIALIGFTGLALDGGELYFLQRNVQNAADAAVLAGLYEICQDPTQVPQEAQLFAIAAAKQAIKDNGFEDGVDGTIVTINPNAIPPSGTYNPVATNYVTVEITAVKPARLIQVVYQGPLQVTVKSAGRCIPTTPWTQGKAVLGMGSCSAPGESVTFSGSGFNIEGGIFGNGDVNINPSGSGGNTVTGGAGGVGSTDDHNKVSYSSPSSGQPAGGQPPINVPLLWDIDEFKGPNGAVYVEATALGKYYYRGSNTTSWSQFGSGHPKPGIYFINGDFTLNSGDLNGVSLNGVTIVATGKIDLGFNGSNQSSLVPYTWPNINGMPFGGKLPAVFSTYGSSNCTTAANDNAVSTSGKASWLGVIYAPFGKCKMSFPSSQSLDGAILCYQVELSGADFSISYNPDWIPPLPPQVGMTG